MPFAGLDCLRVAAILHRNVNLALLTHSSTCFISAGNKQRQSVTVRGGNQLGSCQMGNAFSLWVTSLLSKTVASSSGEWLLRCSNHSAVFQPKGRQRASRFRRADELDSAPSKPTHCLHSYINYCLYLTRICIYLLNDPPKVCSYNLE